MNRLLIGNLCKKHVTKNKLEYANKLSGRKLNFSRLSDTMFRRTMPRLDYNGPPRMNMHRPPRIDFRPPPPSFNFGYTPRMDFNGPPMRMEWDEYGQDVKPWPIKVHCGELREYHTGMLVEISGKVHKQRLGRFLTLKDSNGMTQLIVPDDKPYLVRKVTNIPVDSFMVISGFVSKRPKNQRNTIMSTGSVEVVINKILNVSLHRNNKEASKNINMMQVRYSTNCANSLGVTSEELQKCSTPALSKKFSNRTHNCGELNEIHKGLIVTLCGWIESKQGRFIQMRDGYGLIQAVVPASSDEILATIENAPLEQLIEIVGNVCLRPESQINKTMTTGHIEIQIQSLKLITPDDVEDGLNDSNLKGGNISDSNDGSFKSTVNVNSFTERTYNCSQLRSEHIGQVVTLCGWLEFHRVAKFVILRDGYGRTQLIIPEENKEMQQEIDKLPYESILQITGVVTSRPPGSEQPSMSTGRVEVVIQDLKILNRARPTLPFNLRDFNKAKEPLRMQYRYLDLRYSEMQRNLRTRSKVLMEMREFLINHAGFVDVETPTLFRSTPGGAQEFVVPTRFPGQFYSLVQSPQQFKQLLMAGAIDRYFQIARCYRDEGARSDRQPEFTQLDIEMSFTTMDGVMDLIERLLKHCWPKFMLPLSIPFQRIKYEEAMEIYGTDKPDTTFENKLIDCTEMFHSNSEIVKNFEDFKAKALIFRKPFTNLTNSLKNKYSNLFIISHPNVKLIQNKFNDKTDDWILSISKLLGDTIPNTLIEQLNLESECVLFLAYGNKIDVCSLLGKIRLDFANHLEERGHEIRTNTNMNLMWVIDFPLFERKEDGTLGSVHHPFTAPHPDDINILDSNPFKVRSQAYDLVLNGNEIAGGSIRIHDSDQQKHILNKLKIPLVTMDHLLQALSCGCPPHGGIALGLDRLLSMMLKTNSIRDVIAFPKGLEGRDPMSGAPVPISENDKILYHIMDRKMDDL